jgi:cell shape-determining protein MreD
MSWLPNVSLFFFAWLAVFAQTQFRPVTNLFGTPLAVLPALLVYAALTNRLPTVAALAMLGGLGLDSLSANPLGVSILPLFVVGFGLHLRQHLILRDQRYAQFWLGFAAGILVPLLTLLLLRLDSRPPIVGPLLLWQLLVTGLLNGVVCPGVFRLFDALHGAFDYKPVIEGSFRPDREIKRGRL